MTTSREDKLHSFFVSFTILSSALLLPPLLILLFPLGENLKISSLFLGMGSNGALCWEIHLGFWCFLGVFGPMGWWAVQHLFSWIPNDCVSPESSECSERCSHCYYHHGYLATSFSLGCFASSVPAEETTSLVPRSYTFIQFCTTN